ncbi:recombinase family protein, partial [Salmonella enterica]|nr:recombinase family protein [Salmonella enterica]
MLIDENRVEKGELKFGQRKSIQTDRVILVPGPDNEVNIVNKIFDMFNLEEKPERVIASELNRNKITAENGTEWTRGKIHQILTNEKYIGNNVYNKISFKLKQKYIINPENEWIRYDGAYEPIVSVEKFNLAREIIKNRSIIFSEDELLEKLHSLLIKKGRLSGLLIDEEELLPSSSVYRARFGSLLRVYRLVGYNPKSDYSWLDTKKYLQGINRKMSDKLIENIYLSDGWVSDAHDNGLLNVNDEFTLLIQTIRCQKKQTGGLRWKIKFHHTIAPDVSIAARMDSLNTTVIDYYIFPSIDLLLNNKELKEQNHFTLDMYRFEDLHPLYRLVKRAKLKETIDEPE